jgi:membrane protein implicated in regulation of membrane protease activity
LAWWLWVILGLALMAGELLTPGTFYLLFFGIAGLGVGGLVAIGAPFPLWAQGLSFVVLAVVVIAIFRLPLQQLLQRKTHNQRSIEPLIGEEVTTLGIIHPGEIGSVDRGGTIWQARSEGRHAIPAGSRCRVVSVEGITLTLNEEQIGGS